MTVPLAHLLFDHDAERFALTDKHLSSLAYNERFEEVYTAVLETLPSCVVLQPIHPISRQTVTRNADFQVQELRVGRVESPGRAGRLSAQYLRDHEHRGAPERYRRSLSC